ncbi:MAG: hydroxymethylglutaryl-CoA lyase [Marinoscillum sp.]|jgi:hydroxymethylglutaryl-CoA lyase
MKIIECPRDAIQGLHDFVPTVLKIEYLNELLKVGFDTLDFGSFVSPKAIPQMRDTAEVLEGLELSDSSTKLLAIIANLKGAEQAVAFDQITYLGYPLSLSETFQQRNTNRSIEEAFQNLNDIQALCVKHNKTLVTYLSMGFGNPYNDPYDEALVATFVERLVAMGIKIISLADTVGVATEEEISELFSLLIPAYLHIEFGAHLHATKETSKSKIQAAIVAGCSRLDGALLGYGGCPFAKDELVGNIPTEYICDVLDEMNIESKIDTEQLQHALSFSSKVFG